jgi:hypothetical protein
MILIKTKKEHMMFGQLEQLNQKVKLVAGNKLFPKDHI